MTEENPFEQIQRFFREFQGDINIINEKIEIKLQTEYFEMSKELKNQPVADDLLEKSDILFKEKIIPGIKKKMLVQLASINDVKAYRIIEKYVKSAEEPLKHWSILALQESRMLLQSKLLEQSQVLISTGLGGKDNKLRYFFVLFTKNELPFNELQQKVIKSEFEYIFKNNNSEIEEINFIDEIATILALVPLDIPIQDLFSSVLLECNLYGSFLKDNCIITNVKIMTIEDIRNYLDRPDKI